MAPKNKPMSSKIVPTKVITAVNNAIITISAIISPPGVDKNSSIFRDLQIKN